MSPLMISAWAVGVRRDRFGCWSLLPVGYRVPLRRLSRADDGRSSARMTCGRQAERTICLVESRDNRELAPTTGVEGGTGATKPGVWQSVTTIPWAWLSAGLFASALFAGGVALFSTDPRHRLWGQAAVGGYALAALAVMAWRSRQTRGVDVALAAMMCGAILFPLLWLIAHGYGEPEGGVVATSAKGLVQ